MQTAQECCKCLLSGHNNNDVVSHLLSLCCTRYSKTITVRLRVLVLQLTVAIRTDRLEISTPICKKNRAHPTFSTPGDSTESSTVLLLHSFLPAVLFSIVLQNTVQELAFTRQLCVCATRYCDSDHDRGSFDDIVIQFPFHFLLSFLIDHQEDPW
jgi:hypothetical protein